ncbi:GntR family transcriptional regulator [Sporosarcina sp. P34]|uniref:GntR family transcriptional regulator n=1 Tax=Sporosarcina sp. P34 TaxID=2048247 RepID=UPI000C173108|nr:GntR family transcriptional regulator [Sporosarcina sp. P34]PID14001.1 GntR family transcriptional regulator [Sporosarcina sp. P34]
MKHLETNLESEEEIRRNILEFISQLEGLENYRLPQRAYHIIRLAIRDLILYPGKTILEGDMADLLQMSRTPVREALVRLEAEGMVHLTPRRGFTVEPIEISDLREVYEISEIMEGFAVAKATERIRDNEVNKLEDIIREQERAINKMDLKTWSFLDDKFHRLIIDFAQSKRLDTIIDIHSDQLYRARLYTINQRPMPFQSIIEHKAITSCMRAKDGSAARMIMQSHRKRARNEILRVLDDMNNSQV